MVSTAELVDEIADGARQPQPLTLRSDKAGMVQLAWHAGALALTTFAVSISIGSRWLPVLLFAHGFVLIFLFAPLHETIHRTAFRSRWINTTVSWFCGAALMLPPNYFRAFHFTHHRYTQDPDRDPELGSAKPSTWRSYLWTVSGIPYWCERATTIALHALGQVRSPFISAAAKSGIVREARLLLAVYALIAVTAGVGASAAPLYFWVLPALLGQPFLRMYLLSEHTGCPLVGDMLVNTRTTLTSMLMRRLAWNMPFHTAHHVYPGVPFYGLPETHRRIREYVRHTAPGYVAVQWELTNNFVRGRANEEAY